MSTIYYETDYLMHHGVKGMKWGVRRYQNYDGSYTRTGMQHYRKSEATYDEANSNYKAAKSSYKTAKKTGGDVLSAKSEVEKTSEKRKEAKRQLEKDYNQLKRDKAGDKGKKLYQSGKTITGTETKLRAAAMIAAGTTYVSGYLYQNGNKKAAVYAGAAGGALTAGTAIAAAKAEVEARYLRAYYGHSRN